MTTHFDENSAPSSPLGNRIRALVSDLRQERDVQVKATARIMGAAAAIAQNHDRLIDEVVDMVEDDLNEAEAIAAAESYTPESLQKEFESFPAAKQHFNLKARGWEALADKLNAGAAKLKSEKSERPQTQAVRKKSGSGQSPDVNQRLDAIEAQLAALQEGVAQILQLLSK